MNTEADLEWYCIVAAMKTIAVGELVSQMCKPECASQGMMGVLKLGMVSTHCEIFMLGDFDIVFSWSAKFIYSLTRRKAYLYLFLAFPNIE